MLTRRHFLQNSSLALGAMMTSYPLGLLRAAEEPLHYYLVGAANQVCTINTTTHDIKALELGFKPHGYLQNPTEPKRIWAIEKWGTSAAEFDFEKQTIIRRLTSPEGTQFFGHGIYSKNAETLFISVGSYNDGKGHLVGYDTNTLKQVADYTVAPCGVHDCHYTKDGKLLVASSGVKVEGKVPSQGPTTELSSIVTVDINNGKILHKRYTDDPNQLISHFSLDVEGMVYAVSVHKAKTTDKHGQFYYAKLSEEGLKKVKLPDDYDKSVEGEFLSLAYDKATQRIIVTVPLSLSMIVVDALTGNFIRHVDGTKAHSAFYDSNINKFIIGAKTMTTLNPNTLTVEDFPVSPLQIPHFDGAHGLLVKAT